MIQVYNTKQVAELLKVQPLTIRHYIMKGKLKANFIGRTYVITEDNLNDFVSKKYYI